MLNAFLTSNQIDVKTIERIRHRIFVVGRFNQSRKGELYPDVYLFTNRPTSDLPNDYLNNFTVGDKGTRAQELRYESFVKCLHPALAEIVEYEGNTPKSQIPKVRQLVPRNHKQALEGSSVVDTFHYLFMRGTSSTTQPELVGMRPRLPLGIETVGDKQSAGKGIFKLIRQNLHTFAAFQPRTHEIVEAVSTLLSECAKENGMPPYADGGALPAGFPEKLIDFVYAEDTTMAFDTNGLDLTVPPWNALREDRPRAMFQKVVSSFRNALLGAHIEENGMDRFRGRSLDFQSQSVIKDDLRRDFIDAREAYNGLRQVLRSKALISMVLEWVLSAYYDLPEVTGLPKNAKEADRDEAVENAILHSWDKNEKWINKRVAKPVARPTIEERDRFSTELTSNFEDLLIILTADEATATAKLAKLTPDIRELANDLRNKPRYLEALSGIIAPAGGSINSERKAFIEACKIVLLDILCPALFQQPIMSLDMLQSYFQQETMAAYLTAVFLAKENKGQVRDLAIENLDEFQNRIDKKTQKIRDSGSMTKILLGGFFDLIASDEIARQMTEGLRVLREAHEILSNAPLGSAAGAISAVRPDPALLKSRVLDKTQLKSQEINDSLRVLVDKLVGADGRVTVPASGSTDAAKGKNVAQAIANEPAANPSNQAASGDAGNEPSGSSLGKEKIKGETGDTEIKKGASKAVRQVIDDFFRGRSSSDSQIDKEQVEELAKEATKLLLEDNGFMGKVRSDVRAFEQVLFLIYQRYNENTEKKTFRNRVERLTLINMMLLFQKELGLGTVSSNLYHLLIDLVQHLDPENPDPSTFIREKSLTVYFDNAKLETTGDLSGITNLKKTLIAQAHENLRETVDFVSELWGIKYLIDRVKHDRQAEVIIVNANSNEFLNWLIEDNIQAGRGSGGLRSGTLVGARALQSIQPGLVYMTDAAFDTDEGGKSAFLAKLDPNSFQLSSGGLSFLLPPICISTTYQDDAGLWLEEGSRWAQTAEAAVAPVVIVGPSAFLNFPGDKLRLPDHFRTYLSAGYIFSTYFLSESASQGIEIRAVDGAPIGRLRQIGYGNRGMSTSLERVLWPVDSSDKYGFSVDYYLYVILTVLATAFRNPGNAPNAALFYANFFRPAVGPDDWRSTNVINSALLGGSALKFSTLINAGTLLGVDVDPKREIDGDAPYNVTNVGWFNRARNSAGLP